MRPRRARVVHNSGVRLDPAPAAAAVQEAEIAGGHLAFHDDWRRGEDDMSDVDGGKSVDLYVHLRI